MFVDFLNFDLMKNNMEALNNERLAKIWHSGNVKLQTAVSHKASWCGYRRFESLSNCTSTRRKYYVYFWGTQTFHPLTFTMKLVSVQIPQDRTGMKRRVNLLPRASLLKTKLSLFLMAPTYKLYHVVVCKTNRILIGSQFRHIVRCNLKKVTHYFCASRSSIVSFYAKIKLSTLWCLITQCYS